MPVMDEFREEREQIKNASPEKKWQYFKDYYLKWVIGGAIGVALVIWFIVSMVTKKDEVLNVLFINFAELDTADAQIEQPFTEQFVQNPKKEMIILDASSHIAVGDVSDNMAMVKYTYQDEERLMALAYTGGIDLMISGQDVIERYTEAGWFVSLTDVLDADTIAAYAAEDRVLYYEEIPVAICMDTAELFNANYVYNGEGTPSLYAAFGGGSEHVALAVEFLKFIQ
jgi:hypothetical protein